MNLPKIGRKLRLLIPTTSYVLVRGHDLAPGFQTPSYLTLDRRTGSLSFFAANLLVESHAEQFHLDLFDLFGLRRRDSGQEPTCRIEGPVAVIPREGFLILPP